MGMQPDSTGRLSPVPGYLSEQIHVMVALHPADNLPEVYEVAPVQQLDTVLHKSRASHFWPLISESHTNQVKEYPKLLDSSDMGPPEWSIIAQDIFDNYNRFDGFVVIMGTDTMAYCASAVSFMLENLGKPVIFTGSQVPIHRASSDARRNLLSSLRVAASLRVPEVCIFFEQVLLRANRSRKCDAGSFRAFDSPNFPALATLGLELRPRPDLFLRAPPPGRRLAVQGGMGARMVVVKMAPCFDVGALLRLATAGYETCRAVVLELYGTGNAPSADPRFHQALRAARSHGMVVVVTSQCARGSAVPGTYAVSQELERAGVIHALDMTTEATCAKLAYLFSKGVAEDQLARLMQTSLRGEVGPAPISLAAASPAASSPTPSPGAEPCP
eukprot:CAMPEP_0113673840 /NCGR_PEP_ID=MMETSP0038_2-20120614/7074_1 /TAXON_ID=2898 /ORGANISM="Cryptomonas paramecium" /LENGTH=386 /DNA_ID=CAMNT_0000590329 /DNA_START=185 /DNA_END=1342 /DNA_ORIENTATION=- /assembly_acc=CAM_ASM_000170